MLHLNDINQKIISTHPEPASQDSGTHSALPMPCGELSEPVQPRPVRPVSLGNEAASQGDETGRKHTNRTGSAGNFGGPQPP